MGTLAPSACQALCDSTAKALIDLNSTFVSYPAGINMVSQIQGGLLSANPSLTSRVLALNDAGLELSLLPGAQTTGQTVANGLAATTALSAYYIQFFAFCSALDNVTAGLSNYLVVNSIQVHDFFGRGFNSFAAQAQTLGYRSLTQPVSVIPPSQIFIPANQTLGTMTYSSASANSFTPGMPINGAHVRDESAPDPAVRPRYRAAGRRYEPGHPADPGSAARAQRLVASPPGF